MNPPKSALFVGHPVIAVPVCLATVTVFCWGFQDTSWWLLAVLMLWPAGVIARANKARTDYFQWKQAWDGMAAEPTRQKQPRRTAPVRWRPWLGGLLLAAVMLFCAANANDPLDRLALIWIGVVVGIAGIAKLIWRPKTARRSKGIMQTVTVCVSGPLLPVPSLKNAYRAMPEHCLSVLGIARR